jgi:hypothetical protein
MAAAAAASVLVIGTTLPAAATGEELDSRPSHSDWANHDGKKDDDDKGHHGKRDDDDKGHHGKKDDDDKGHHGKKDDDDKEVKVVKVVKVIKVVEKDDKDHAKKDHAKKDDDKDHAKKDDDKDHAKKDDDKDDDKDHVAVPTKVNAGLSGVEESSGTTEWVLLGFATAGAAALGTGAVVARRRNTAEG